MKIGAVQGGAGNVAAKKRIGGPMGDGPGFVGPIRPEQGGAQSEFGRVVSQQGPTGPEAAQRATKPDKPEGPGLLRRQVEGLMKDERKLDHYIRRAMRGSLDINQVISLQVSVYRYTQQMDLFSKSIDRANQAVRQLLQTRM
ncbi:MAG: hypothetical protein J7M25_06065 [Deltaproteobacteria bacterium]|nr:hypothetical protein [Deltaproteobacteria bacterium]